MDRDTTISRYPFMLAQIANDPTPPDRIATRADAGQRVVAGAVAMSSWFVRLVLWSILLGIVVLLILAVWQS